MTEPFLPFALPDIGEAEIDDFGLSAFALASLELWRILGLEDEERAARDELASP
jgi:hypothetical protein